MTTYNFFIHPAQSHGAAHHLAHLPGFCYALSQWLCSYLPRALPDRTQAGREDIPFYLRAVKQGPARERKVFHFIFVYFTLEVCSMAVSTSVPPPILADKEFGKVGAAAIAEMASPFFLRGSGMRPYFGRNGNL